MAVNQPSPERARAGPLRIAMVVPPWLSVPPPGYGGLETLVAGLVDALIDRGHAVTLFGAGTEHGTAAEFVSTCDELQYDRMGESLPELAHLAHVDRLLDPADFDLVHDHSTIGPLVAGRRRVPTVATVHGNPVGEYGTVLSNTDRGVGLIAISHAQRRANAGLPWVGTVHNAMPLRDFPHKRAPGRGPVLWLARFSPDKGPDVAIRACRAAGLPLTLAGKCNEPAERRYLEQVVGPLLDDDVDLVVNADRDTVLRLLLDARCLVMPIQWAEPFGMVMVEAMATGTPVVALRRGAVPELVRPGLTGLVCDRTEELAAALRAVADLDPADCITHVARNFSVERMAADHEAVYRAFLAGRATAEGPRAVARLVAG
ncbi:glycosyltransferase family 4 protein [Micromonospora sp. WMMD980]|uniref:glycosyltransferase family 4 protein n=1 Tax=Micromonospora sp. WMMD980 TaxID=3016088 RepID=UPI002417CF2D|nr:glycosyltransferase family 4 protein [Micromonospora sp. WMMD980]MDG4804932.1 glycosyltransferase family 4 protein [Micromonospora sp. WMMD980]